MIPQLTQPVLILLRKRLPQTKEEWLSFSAIFILMVIYYLIKEKILRGIIKWVVASALFLGGIIGLFISQNREAKYFLWCLTGAFFYCVLFELLKRFTINRRDVYVPPGENSLEDMGILTKEEELDINKIVLVLLVLWLITGFIIT